jgi:hypothetical protein
MSDNVPRIEPQYLHAASQQAATYYGVIWQKMGYLLVIQYGGITADYGTISSASASGTEFINASTSRILEGRGGCRGVVGRRKGVGSLPLKMGIRTSAGGQLGEPVRLPRDRLTGQPQERQHSARFAHSK